MYSFWKLKYLFKLAIFWHGLELPINCFMAVVQFIPVFCCNRTQCSSSRGKDPGCDRQEQFRAHPAGWFYNLKRSCLAARKFLFRRDCQRARKFMEIVSTSTNVTTGATGRDGRVPSCDRKTKYFCYGHTICKFAFVVTSWHKSIFSCQNMSLKNIVKI